MIVLGLDFDLEIVVRLSGARVNMGIEVGLRNRLW
jgi:hypothetical protein